MLRLLPALMSSSDVHTKANVPALHLRLDEIVDLAVPLALRPKKPYVGKQAASSMQLAAEPTAHYAATVSLPPSASTFSTTPALPPIARKESRKVIEGLKTSSLVSTVEAPTARSDPPSGASMQAELRVSAAPALPLKASPPKHFMFPDKLAASMLPSVDEKSEGQLIALVPHAGDSMRLIGRPPAAHAEVKHADARLRQHCEVLHSVLSAAPSAAAASNAVDAQPSFDHLMRLIEQSLRSLSVGDPTVAQSTLPALADAVSAARVHAVETSSRHMEEIVLLTRNNALLVDVLLESQAAEMSATVARLRGGVL